MTDLAEPPRFPALDVNNARGTVCSKVGLKQEVYQAFAHYGQPCARDAEMRTPQSESVLKLFIDVSEEQIRPWNLSN